MDLANFKLGEVVLVGFLGMTFFAASFFVVYRVGGELFSIYRKNFIQTVDKGFRDTLIYLDAGQVFSLTLVSVAVLGPILFYLTSPIVSVACIAGLLVAPRFYINRIKEKRAEAFIKQLPDALASMSGSLRAGLNLIKALNQVVKNQPEPIKSEFAQVIVEYRVGKDLNESFAELAKRIEREELVLLNSSIRIAREVGGNLADTLDAIAHTLREKAKVEGKVRALTSMGRAQGMVAVALPLVVGFFVFQIEPRSMSKLFTTSIGLWWIGIMGGMMFAAWMWIKRIVRIEV